MSQSPLDNEPVASASNAVKERGLLKSSGLTGSMTLVSRILGLARDIAIARLFGTSDGTDAFLLANKIPNFLRRLFAEGAFNQAFVPVLSEYRSTKSHLEVQELVNAVAASLGGLLAVVTAIVWIIAPLLAVPLAYGFIDEPIKFSLFIEMLRITFPYLLLVSMTALCSATLNSYGKFAIPALTPALLNISLIACAFLLAPYLSTPELALAWGVLIAGFAQLLFQLPFLAQINLLPVPKRKKDHEGVLRIKSLMIPALFGVSISQINLMLDTFIASLLIAGSVSWLYFSDRLMELPLGTFGIAIAIVVLPSLSRRHAEKSIEEFSATLDWAFRIVCLIALPASMALILIAEPLLITLFQNDKFDMNDVIQSAGSLRAYSIGLLAFMAIKIFAPGFYARQNTSAPVKIGVIAMVANMVMNLGFYLAGFAHVGLALATSLAAYLNAGLLVLALRKEGVFSFHPGWLVFSFRLLFANAAMAVFLLYMKGEWEVWATMSLWVRVAHLAAMVLGGALLYAGCLLAAGLRWRHIYR
ncbi:MAG: putative peptidoglycan lipid II flippase [Pseudohongiellaceae bacterium]|jgi:putative peptidoglycan lipid II flippase